MKLSIKQYLITAAIVLCYSLNSTAQLSKKLLASLPGTAKPVPENKAVLNIPELTAIVKLAADSPSFRFNKEIDSLSAILVSYPAVAKDTQVLITLIDFYYQKGNFDTAILYCDKLIALCGPDNAYTLDYENQKVYILSLLGRYEACINNSFSILEKTKRLGDSSKIADAYASFYMPYLSLGLNRTALNYLDSGIAYYSKPKNADELEIYRGFISGKFIGYLNLFEETDSSIYADKMRQTASYYQAQGYDLSVFKLSPVIDQLMNRNYGPALRLCDSLINSETVRNKKKPGFMPVFLYKTKAICLYQLGHKQTALGMLDTTVQKIYAVIADNPVLRPYANVMLLKTTSFLYKGYRDMGQENKALYYLEMNRHLTDTLDILKNRGTVFETNQRYNFSRQEAEARQLIVDNTIREKERNIAIIVTIASVLSLLVIASWLVNRYKKLRLKKQLAEQDAQNQIERLNMASQIQIDELEEKNRMAKAEEQKRLGQELHDNLSGTLAAAKIKLENEAIKMHDNALHLELKDIAAQIAVAYANTRNKSHDLYNTSNETGDIGFSKRVQLITTNVLPGKHYSTTVNIDEEVLANIGLSAKINILRIIQESLTNILKYAGAQQVSIDVYKETGSIAILKINDDGKGFDISALQTGKGVGLRSIQDRVEEMNGELHISSTEKGTEVKVVFPLVAA